METAVARTVLDVELAAYGGRIDAEDVGTGSVAGPVMKGRDVALIPGDMSPTGKINIIPTVGSEVVDTTLEVGEVDTLAGVVVGGPGGVTALAEGVGVT
jgi:hypothetical protein